MNDPRIEPAAIALYVAVQPNHRTPEGWNAVKPIWRKHYESSAVAVIAALDKAATIWAVEELDELPVRSFVQGYDGFRHEKRSGGWLMLTESSTDLHGNTSVELPARVLYRATE